MEFRYHPDILTNFPKLRGAVILASSINNQPSPEKLQEAFIGEQRRVLELIGNTPLSELPTLAAWRQAFRIFGVDPTKYRSACEALLRRLTKKGDIPSINTLVDICNLVSIRYALPVAAFDVRALQGPVTVHFASGEERFIPLGQDEIEHPDVGEVIFSDETKLVIARRWCWRQSSDSAVGLETRKVIFTIEAQHNNNMADIDEALNDLLVLLNAYTSGTFISGVLDKNNPAINT